MNVKGYHKLVTNWCRTVSQHSQRHLWMIIHS